MGEEANKEKAPLVFISYSHDTPVHKKWVGELASRLVKNGVDVIVDQWNLDLGDDAPKFMERSVTEADRVLMICTEAYVRKADDGKGGVGYEAMIVTGELVKNLGTAKFIPIVRQENGATKVPKCVGTRIWVNLGEGQGFDDEFEKLLRALHKAPQLPKPPLGKNPFFGVVAGALDAGADNTMDGPTVAEVVALEDPAATYKRALALARRRDVSGWRELAKRIRQPLPAKLLAWEQKNLGRVGLFQSDLPLLVIEAATLCAPLMSVALAGVQSGEEKFVNQVGILDDLNEPKGWIRNGLTVVVGVPDALVYIYQALHGALCLQADQLPLAMNLSRTRLYQFYHGKAKVLCQDAQWVGQPESLPAGYGWHVLATIPEKWPWLLDVFDSADSYQAALCAYYMALNIQELADRIQMGGQDKPDQPGLGPRMPLSHHITSSEIQRAGYRLLLLSPHKVRAVWRRVGVEDAKIEECWPTWIQQCQKWLEPSNPFGRDNELPQTHLFEDLGREV